MQANFSLYTLSVSATAWMNMMFKVLTSILSILYCTLNIDFLLVIYGVISCLIYKVISSHCELCKIIFIVFGINLICMDVQVI